MLYAGFALDQTRPRETRNTTFASSPSHGLRDRQGLRDHGTGGAIRGNFI